MNIKLIILREDKINEIFKIKRTSEKYVGLIEDVFDDFNNIYKDYSDLVIDETYQRKGYGKLATNKIIEHFKIMNESNIIKIEVFNENISAIKCYEKCGFKITKQCDWNNSFVEMEIVL